MSDLVAATRAWIDDDPDPATADELRELLDHALGDGFSTGEQRVALAELADRFSGPLEFGTAGLRGALGAGPHRMNRAVVIRAAAGLVHYLTDALGSPGPAPRVVIGYDARFGSSDFAADTADVVAAAGGHAYLLPAALPTPVLAFAVRHLDADAGVMVTASHNPPQDNGYKVYLGGRVVTDAGQGAQIVPPADAEISARIALVPSVASVPRSAADAAATGGSREVLGSGIVDAYAARATALVPDGVPRDLRIVLTPLHGVGGALAGRVLAQAGFADVTLVAEQADPDPTFPTVAFPNPEEPGALDLAFATAARVGADLIIANDPDADRCSVAVPDVATVTGWRQLTGDEVGALLGEQAAAEAAGHVAAAGRATGGASGPGVLASSIVSSRLLAAIAAHHGLAHRATLTGFKWISRVDGLVFGYEEALGYCTDPAAVRDKDGITAAVRIAALAADLHAHGRTLTDVLDDLARRHGLHATAPLSVRVEDPGLIAAAQDRLRKAPPTTLAGSAVAEVVDLAQGSADLPPTDGLLYLTEANDRVIVRPSGTEPKIKCYLEVIETVAPGEDLGPVRAQAASRLELLKADIAAAAGLVIPA
ncbi:phospho-sugar mutase [Occultella aeris]|uniref:Putative phosphomannomutase n=1 Tax=Occultella aeris TaxID=2761496 RepID=A0A7M4DLU4_9MICO|nr:phospho-sugar mutase [Occultella aeris]VZO38274.1 putative phosphomannomutase [Occultella aeris]